MNNRKTKSVPYEFDSPVEESGSQTESSLMPLGTTSATGCQVPCRREILVDGDIVAYKIAAREEYAADWGEGLWTLHGDADAAVVQLDSYIQDLIERLEADSYRVAVTASSNWRKKILATYKSNRKETRKPLTLPVLVAHMIEKHKAARVDRLEADDILGSWATESIPGVQRVLVSEDKDFATIPGWHYNPNRAEKGIYFVDEESSRLAHLTQTLTGDQSDGYSGCPGVGPKTAPKILAGDLKTVWSRIVTAFEKAGLNGEEALIQARVAYILRHGDYNHETKDITLWDPEINLGGLS